MKEIEDFVGYCITEEGDAISFKRKTPKVLKKLPVSGGYLQVGLYKDGEVYWRKIHRLVAEAFIPNPLGLSDVNHKNEDKTDNRVENLEWCTREYNVNYGTRNERAGEAHRKPVIAYTYKDGSFYGEYPSAREAARQLGLFSTNITQCCKGKLKHTGDFAFRFKDGE